MANFPRNEELDDFKSRINFCDYASLYGFSIEAKQSSRSCAALKHSNGDKLIVSRGVNHHWKYFNVHDSRDRGTIIDFVQIRKGYSLGEVRKELRNWTGGSLDRAHSRSSFAELVPSEHDVAEVLVAWEKAKPINGLHDYLQAERKISSRVLCDPIFAGRIRTDDRKNALFAHYNHLGICGYEIKNQRFTGFSPGGVKGLFCSRPRKEDSELIICETAIDALSYATLFGMENKRFLSTAGQISPFQKSLLQSAAKKLPSDSTIALAMDNDDGGHKLAGMIRQVVMSVGFDEKRIVQRLPLKQGADWNDVLRSQKSCREAFPAPLPS